jgi:general transcription factor 3C polypeptide 5 (transcription factor C subunit 1)
MDENVSAQSILCVGSQRYPEVTPLAILCHCPSCSYTIGCSSKLLLPLCCYVFQDGPWRDTLVRFSYDPRKDPDSRLYDSLAYYVFCSSFTHSLAQSYQRIYFRNANHPISRPSVTTRRHERISANDYRPDRDAERK